MTVTTSMSNELSDAALDFGAVVKRAIGAAGGDRLVGLAEAQVDARRTTAAVLGELGAWDLNPRASIDELEAAAALCRSSGYWAAPYPVAERLSRPPDLDVAGLSVVNIAVPAGPLAGIELAWAAVTIEGRRFRATPNTHAGDPRTTGFVVGLDLEPIDDCGALDVAYGLVLPCWTLLGMLDRAIELTCEYARHRHQFGQALATFQGVQFQLTEAEVERAGVEELAKYALWSLEIGSPDALADALALRLATVEAAEVVMGVAHQVHGATGFCDDSFVSWISRSSRALRRLPFGPASTRTLLARHISDCGLTGIFAVDTVR